MRGSRPGAVPSEVGLLRILGWTAVLLEQIGGLLGGWYFSDPVAEVPLVID
jgi:hypothetical protein